MKKNIIRKATEDDVGKLYQIARELKAKNEIHYFERCLVEQNAKKREIFIAEFSGEPAGYVQLIWSPIYPPFKKLDIPEIQDLNVVPDMRCKGIGSMLVDHCEEVVKNAGKEEVGIGFGLNSNFGAAHRLYIKKGYIPDGLGVSYDDELINAGDLRAVDDFLTLKLTKKI